MLCPTTILRARVSHNMAMQCNTAVADRVSRCVSREVHREEPPTAPIVLWSTGYWKDVDHPRGRASNIRRRLPKTDPRGTPFLPSLSPEPMPGHATRPTPSPLPTPYSRCHPPAAERVGRPRDRRRARADQELRRDPHAVRQGLQAHRPR